LILDYNKEILSSYQIEGGKYAKKRKRSNGACS